MESQVYNTIASLLIILIIFGIPVTIVAIIYGANELIKMYDPKILKTPNDIINTNGSYEQKTINKNYKTRNIMTNCESNFFYKLKQLEQELNVRIQPQVNLGTIIEKTNNTKYRNELFRNIDFGVFTQNYERLLLLIELNDSSHKNYTRAKRDKKVEEICRDANIKLITFYTRYPNTKEYIRNKIIQELSK